MYGIIGSELTLDSEVQEMGYKYIRIRCTE